jgi:hypothetical protein
MFAPYPVTMISSLEALVFAIPVSLGHGGRVTSFGKDEKRMRKDSTEEAWVTS